MSSEMNELPDPLIDEVRERRRQLWTEYDNDLNNVYEAIKRLQAQHPEKLVDPRSSRKANTKK